MRQRKIIVSATLRREQGRKKIHRTRSYKNALLEKKIKELSRMGLRPNSNPSTLGQMSRLVGLGLELKTAAKLTKKQASKIIVEKIASLTGQNAL